MRLRRHAPEKSTDPYFTYKSSETTAIDDMEPVGRDGVSAGVYTLTGNKERSKADGLRGLPAGLYVVDGRKVVVR